MVKDAAFAGVVLAGDIDASLLVQPPRRQAQVVRDVPCLFQDDAVGEESGVDVARDPCGVVSKSHGGAADNKDVGDDAPADQALTKVGKGSL